MVEVLLFVVLIVGIRAVYLRIFRGKREAKGFVEESAKGINQAMGCIAIASVIILVLFVLLIAVFS